MNMDGTRNGAGRTPGPPDLLTEPPPEAVRDLAEGCVRFVEQALGMRLDYQPETLPLLDHYLAQARAATSARAEALPVVAQMAGAYFGEVIRRRHASWWRIEGDDPTYWQIELESVYLAFSPVLFVRESLARSAPEGEPRDDKGEPRDDDELRDDAGEPHEQEGEPRGGDPAGLELEEDDRQAVEERLANLPPVPEEEYHAPSTRLEVIDIAVEAIRARRVAAGHDVEATLTPDDYKRRD